MMLIESLLIPENLVSAALEEAASTGWYGGQVWEREGLMFCAQLVRGNGETVYSTARVSFLAHRSFLRGERRDNLLRWAWVRAGAHGALKSRRVPQDAIAGWLVPAGFLDAVANFECICLLEPGNPPRASGWIVYEYQKERVAFRIHHEILHDHPNPYARLDGVAALRILADRRVLVVGLGSGGGVVALDLASSGVGSLDLVDRDFLEQANLLRHVAGAQDVGRAKVRALSGVFADHLLSPRLDLVDEDGVVKADAIRDLVDRVDLAVCCVDDRRMRELLNYVCVRAGKPLILAWTFQNAALGEIIRVIPRQTGCLTCIRMAQGLAIEPPPDDEGTPLSYMPELHDPVPSRATRTDVFLIAELTAKVCLMTLTDDRPDFFGRPPGDYLLWANRATPDLKPPFNFEAALALRALTYEPLRSCPICGEMLLAEGTDVEAVYRRVLDVAATVENPAPPSPPDLA